jgi:two-component system sensor histidine kinase MtrB
MEHHEPRPTPLDDELDLRDRTLDPEVLFSASDEMAMVAHDLRSPLTVLLGAARHLARTDEPEELRGQLAAMIERAATQVEALVEDLLRTAQPADAVRGFAREPVDLTALVGELAHHASVSHGAAVEVHAEESITTWTDPGAVQRILQNLLENAIRHGAPPFRIDLATTPTGVAISVTNHGPSIDDATRARLFGRFRPGTGTTSGTGLGLHIVWRLARALGGSVEVRDVGDATVFVVELPQRQR